MSEKQQETRRYKYVENTYSALAQRVFVSVAAYRVEGAAGGEGETRMEIAIETMCLASNKARTAYGTLAIPPDEARALALAICPELESVAGVKLQQTEGPDGIGCENGKRQKETA